LWANDVPAVEEVGFDRSFFQLRLSKESKVDLLSRKERVTRGTKATS
jgi:hypothetical protein